MDVRSKSLISPTKKIRVKLFQQPANTKELGKWTFTTAPSLQSERFLKDIPESLMCINKGKLLSVII